MVTHASSGGCTCSFQTLSLNNDVWFVAALIAYAWLVSLDEEIKLFWNRKVTAATMLYFPIRYLVIIYWAMCYPEVCMRGMVR